MCTEGSGLYIKPKKKKQQHAVLTDCLTGILTNLMNCIGITDYTMNDLRADF